MTLKDSWDALKTEEAKLREEQRQQREAFHVKMDAFVAWVISSAAKLEAAAQVIAGAPDPEPAPPEVVTPPFSITPPPSVEPSRPSIGPSVIESPTWRPTPGVLATMWRNRADEGVDPATMGNGVTCQPGDGWRHAWVSLPAQIRDGIQRRVWLRLTSSPFALTSGPYSQTDIGPWWDGTRGTAGSYSPDLEDHWWDGAPARRPRVETERVDARGRVDNGAGIDITPRAGAEIVKAAGQHPELTVEQLAQQYYEHPCELMVDVWVEEIAETQEPDRPSPHFTWAEVSRSDRAESAKISNVVPTSLRDGVRQFAAGIVEPLRVALGRPMRYGVDWTSWYRSSELNALVGGATASDHLTGRGLDVPRTEEFWRALRSAKVKMPLKINVEPDHYDVKVGEGDVGTVAVNWINGAVKAAWEV